VNIQPYQQVVFSQDSQTFLHHHSQCESH